MKQAVLAALVILTLVVAGGHPEAHKPITSPYTYNEDVFPIVRDRCGRCHVAGGVAPMSLMTAKDAVPWGESIRTELIAGHMPPWSVDAAPGRFKNLRDADRSGAERSTDVGDGRQSGRQPGTRAASRDAAR